MKDQDFRIPNERDVLVVIRDEIAKAAGGSTALGPTAICTSSESIELLTGAHTSYALLSDPDPVSEIFTLNEDSNGIVVPPGVYAVTVQAYLDNITDTVVGRFVLGQPSDMDNPASSRSHSDITDDFEWDFSAVYPASDGGTFSVRFITTSGNAGIADFSADIQITRLGDLD